MNQAFVGEYVYQSVLAHIGSLACLTLLFPVFGIASAVDGVVIATEKKLPSILVDEKSVEKISILSYVGRAFALKFMCFVALITWDSRPVSQIEYINSSYSNPRVLIPFAAYSSSHDLVASICTETMSA